MIGGLHPALVHAPQGDGGPPLVLLHGFLGSPAAWNAALGALAHRGPACCPWLPGHGPAAPRPATFDAAAQAIADALPEDAILAGYSMGARLALAATLRRPGRARATLLIGGHVGLAGHDERAARAELDARRAAALRGGDLAAFVADWEAMPMFASQQALPAARQDEQRAARLAHDPRSLVWAFEVAGLAQMPDLRPAVAAARQRLCFLTGARDARFGAVAASVVHPPWVTHHIVAGAGHNLLLEAPDAVAATLTSLMRGE